MNNAVVWGFLLRFCQCLLQASPFILSGLFIAGVFQRLMMYPAVKRLFGGGTYTSLIQAWGLGMLLPVCSLGVIPVIREMKKAGLVGGTILAFAMSAPLFNPLSLMYGLTLSEPMTILAFAVGSLVIVTVVGTIWDQVFDMRAADPIEQKPVSYGFKRMLAIFVVMARSMTNWTAIYIIVGLVGVALLGAALPKTSLQRMANFDNPLAPVFMSGIAIPVYATPMLAMSQLGMMFQHANSVGAAFVLLTLGAGMNLGLCVWMAKEYGIRRALAWISLLLLVVLGIAYGIEKPLFPVSIEPADHTHAFDVYCRPFDDHGIQNLAVSFLEKLKRDIAFFEWYSFYGLACVLAMGLVLRVCDRWFVIEDWLEKESVEKVDGYDLAVPGWAIGCVSLIGLIAFSILGCYAFYPPPQEAINEMSIVQAEALSPALSGDATQADYWIEVYDDWTRKLEVGVYLRKFHLNNYQKMKSRLVRDKLELLKHEVADLSELLKSLPQGNKETPEIAEARTHVSHLTADTQRCFLRMKSAYLQEM